MRILVVGSGGREHALAWKLGQSPLAEAVFVAPGNGGTCDCAQNVNISASDIHALVKFARNEHIDLVIPGPELPLTLGIADAMEAAGIACFGPDSFCARLEGSKAFAKAVMARAGVPTARCEVFKDAEPALQYARNATHQMVIKADGLAAGKGVVVADTKEEALAAIEDMLLAKQFGSAGETILIEERLTGEEVSLLCFCDGKTAKPLASAQDHKAAFDNDTGPNTGGMGAYSPAPALPDDQLENMTDLVIRPVITELARQGHPFKGILYAGLMLTEAGPRVLEYNVRFGDPECQPLLMRLDSDLAALALACARGTLEKQELEFRPETAIGVVLAAEGYPGSYEKGISISGIDSARQCGMTQVFHSGTEKEEGVVKSSGGRVLCVTSLGADLAEARHSVYNAMEKIQMPHSRFRRDIGAKGLRHLAGVEAK